MSGVKYTMAGPAMKRASASAVRAPGVFLQGSLASHHSCSKADWLLLESTEHVETGIRAMPGILQAAGCTYLSVAADSRPKDSAFDNKPDLSMNDNVRPFLSASERRPACSAFDSSRSCSTLHEGHMLPTVQCAQHIMGIEHRLARWSPGMNEEAQTWRAMSVLPWARRPCAGGNPSPSRQRLQWIEAACYGSL